MAYTNELYCANGSENDFLEIEDKVDEDEKENITWDKNLTEGFKKTETIQK